MSEATPEQVLKEQRRHRLFRVHCAGTKRQLLKRVTEIFPPVPAADTKGRADIRMLAEMCGCHETHMRICIQEWTKRGFRMPKTLEVKNPRGRPKVTYCPQGFMRMLERIHKRCPKANTMHDQMGDYIMKQYEDEDKTT